MRKKRICAPARGAALLLLPALLLLFAQVASAKTLESAKGENIFFYARDADGKAVLLKILTSGELKERSHGQLSGLTGGGDTGKNYFISSTDNYPTTQYCEARGITVPELVAYVKSVTSVPGASALGFSGADTIRLMATDSYGNYNRAWTYDELYGVKRYYFEGLFDERTGWKTAWEVAGEEDSKFGLTLDAYNEKHRDSDPYYAEKRAVFDGGAETVPILATESYSGRTTSSTLVASTEIGIADDIAKNGGTVAGSLKDKLADTWSLRLSLPMTEADLMAAHRTAFDNFKWIYNLRLDMAEAPALRAAGTVAEPVANASVSGDALTFEISCATPDAKIFYSFDGAPQIPYTGPVTSDVAGRDLASEPVTFYMTAVREGCADAGVVTVKYPGLAPAFKTLYSAMAGEALVFEAADGTGASDWRAWTDALTFVSVKTPGAGGYARVDAGKYRVDEATKAIDFDASLLSEAGSYSFIFHARGYADKSASLTVKKPAPAIAARGAKIGRRIAFTFEDADYGEGLSLYVTPQGGESVIISSNLLDRTQPGRVILKAAYFAGASCPVREPGAYTFSFVNSRFEPGTVDVNVTLSADGETPDFDDAAPTAWYYDAVLYVASEGLFDEQRAGLFGPGDPMTRAMFAVALHRLEGSPEAAARADFTDVAPDTPLSEAVSWARGAGIVNGTGDGAFAGDAGLTREQFAAMLYRYALYKDADLAEKGDLSAFTDAGRVSAFAREAIAWANGAGIVNGMGDGTLAPQGGTTRAQAATMLMHWNSR
jgi:hypothetical protein